MLVLMAALAALLLWQWMREITGSTSAATFAWAAAALTAPYLFNTFTVYPEIPGALAVMVAMAWRPESTSVGVMLLRGVAIGALPWLSTKYAPMAAAVTLRRAAAHAVERARDGGGARARSAWRSPHGSRSSTGSGARSRRRRHTERRSR